MELKLETYNKMCERLCFIEVELCTTKRALWLARADAMGASVMFCKVQFK